MSADRPRITRIFTLLAGFLAAALVLGILTSGLLMPGAAAVGALTRSGEDAFHSLPNDFTVNPLAQGSRILAADGSLIATPQSKNRHVVSLRQVAPIMRKAQVAIEDSRFYEHGPIDPQGLIRAAFEDLRSGTATQGGSTITQQFVKMSLQEQALANGNTSAAKAAVEKSMLRKIVELRYAVALGRKWSKDQILQGYLNLAYYGDQAYGVEAAARHYFGVHAAKLTLTEAATLAGLVQRPSATDPVHHPKAATARRNVVLDRMRELGIITRAQWHAAKARPMAKDLHVTYLPSTCAASSYPYFCDFVLRWLEEQPALGPNVEARRNRIYSGGLTIRTTLDPHVQGIVDRSIREVAPEHNTLAVGAAAYVTEPGTGKVLAFGQNTKYGLTASSRGTSVDYALDQQYGGSGGFQFGSTAKAFSLVTAMAQGLGTHATVQAPAANGQHAATFTPRDFPQPCGLSQDWQVYNDEAWGGGTMSLMNATAQSTNTAFVALAERIGVCAIRDTMVAFGIHGANGDPLGKYPPQIILGAQAVSPQTMANAYAGLAADGTSCKTYPVTDVSVGDKHLWRPKPDCKQVADPSAVSKATQYLEYNMTHGSGILNQLAGRPSAGKTGTADGNSQSWFVGYTPSLATAVWVGNPTDPTRRMFDVSMQGKSCTAMTGACFAALIWRRIMDRTLDGTPAESMP
ncbi:MAG: penicillin-binding protein [Micrococcales bacterium]|nr:penicillin-binding protein [Micrococcales bacterium]